MSINKAKRIAESIVIIRLPEGDYAARGTMSDTATVIGDEKNRIALRMLEGEEIPVGGREKNFLEFESVLYNNFNAAIEEFVRQIKLTRQNNGFSPSVGSKRRMASVLPTDTGRRVRVKRSDGVTIELPAITMAIPIKALRPDGGQVALDEKTDEAFNSLAVPIEELRGKAVLYRPTLYADELYQAEVEASSNPRDQYN
jgi:hypothetical protein